MSSNISFSSSTSERYALALYELAKEKSQIEKTTEEINNLKEILVKSEDFKKMLSNPTIARHDQGKAIANLSEFGPSLAKLIWPSWFLTIVEIICS